MREGDGLILFLHDFDRFTWVVTHTLFAGHLLNATTYSYTNLRRIISQRHNNNSIDNRYRFHLCFSFRFHHPSSALLTIEKYHHHHHRQAYQFDRQYGTAFVYASASAFTILQLLR